MAEGRGEEVASEEDDLVVVGASSNPEVASGMHKFIAGVQGDRQFAGVSSLLLLALQSKVRVFVWYGRRREDVVQVYAPWAVDRVTQEAAVEAVACRLSVDEDTGTASINVIEDDEWVVNHWVACLKVGASHGDGAEAGIAELDGGDDATTTMEAIYLSLGRVVLQTIADGDCLYDVMCLILNTTRAERSPFLDFIPTDVLMVSRAAPPGIQ